MRRRVVVAVLAWAALWPLAHRALVASYDVNPWKLFGWAMYSVASPPVLVAGFDVADGAQVRVDEDLPPEARSVLATFSAERHALGRARRPDDLAQALFEAKPELTSLVVVVQRAHLDWRTGHMVSSRELYPYRRPGNR